MSLDAAGLVSVAKEWLERRGSPRLEGQGVSDPSNLIQVSREVHRLLRCDEPSAEHLRTAETLFDDLASSRWDNCFGERLETCMLLAYVGWRHSFLLGLDVESQLWLRIADQLVREHFAAVEPTRIFLHLDESQSSASLDDSHLSAPSDVFLALSILRSEVGESPRFVMRSAGHVFRFLAEQIEKGTTDDVATFFLGEVAFVGATAARTLGLKSETRGWARAARSLFAKLPSNRPLRAKLLALRFVTSYERRRRHSFELRAEKLIRELARLGMQHEILLIRVACACSIKLHGDNATARAEFEALRRDCADTSERAALVVALANLTEIAADDEPERARELIPETLREIASLRAPISAASALMGIGAAFLSLSEFENSIRMFRTSVVTLRGAGSALWLAYGEILLAEALIAGGKHEEAHQSIARALPIIRSEGMVDEGVHAAKLLAQLEALEFDSRRGLRARPRERPRS